MTPYIYLETSFFKLLRESKQGFVSKSLISHVPQALNDMSKLIFSDDNKTIIIKEEETEGEDFDLKELIRVFEDLHVQGKINLKKVSEDEFNEELEKIGSYSPHSICFCSKPNHTLRTLVEQKGYYHIDEENLDGFIANPLFEKDTYGVSKNGDISEWKDLTSLSHNFESVAIFDRYIFSKNQKKGRSSYEETIYELINNLSQKNSAKNIHALIAAPKSTANEEPEKIKKNIEHYFKKKEIEKNITIGIVKTMKKSALDHDRWIFTNFMSIFSGDSLNYFTNGQQSDIDTTINTNTLLGWTNFKSNLKKLKKYSEIIPDTDKIGTEAIRAGNCNLSLINDDT